MDTAERERRWNSAKAKRAAAQQCFDQQFYSESATRSYYACYQAMWVAVGNPRTGLWRHGGLINEFCHGRWHKTLTSQLIPLRKKLDRLYLYRIQSDYEARTLTMSEAQECLNTTDEVLQIVSRQTSLVL